VWLGWRRSVFACVGCQVTLCDPIWQVTLRSCEMDMVPYWYQTHEQLYGSLLYFYFIYGTLRGGIGHTETLCSFEHVSCWNYFVNHAVHLLILIIMVDSIFFFCASCSCLWFPSILHCFDAVVGWHEGHLPCKNLCHNSSQKFFFCACLTRSGSRKNGPVEQKLFVFLLVIRAVLFMMLRLIIMYLFFLSIF